MKIWHVGASPTPNEVNGINYLVWELAETQASLGHEVTMVLFAEPSADAVCYAAGVGVTLAYIQARSYWLNRKNATQALNSGQPEVVLFHSVFILLHAILGFLLRRRNVSYVVVPHGGLNPRDLKNRSRMRKAVYSRLVQRRFFGQASAMVVGLPDEETHIRQYLPNYRGLIEWIPNAVNTSALQAPEMERTTSQTPTLLYLGLFDVRVKGIDVLARIASRLPAVEFHLHGLPVQRERNERELLEIRHNAPENMLFLSPIYGDDKVRAFRSATAYIQTSRWESFGISIAEAMYMGLPCFISSSISMATLFREHDLGCVLPPDEDEAVKAIHDALSNEALLCEWSRRAKAFANEHFTIGAVGEAYSALCVKVIGNPDTAYPSVGMAAV